MLGLGFYCAPICEQKTNLSQGIEVKLEMLMECSLTLEHEVHEKDKEKAIECYRQIEEQNALSTYFLGSYRFKVAVVMKRDLPSSIVEKFGHVFAVCEFKKGFSLGDKYENYAQGEWLYFVVPDAYGGVIPKELMPVVASNALAIGALLGDIKGAMKFSAIVAKERGCQKKYLDWLYSNRPAMMTGIYCYKDAQIEYSLYEQKNSICQSIQEKTAEESWPYLFLKHFERVLDASKEIESVMAHAFSEAEKEIKRADNAFTLYLRTSIILEKYFQILEKVHLKVSYLYLQNKWSAHMKIINDLVVERREFCQQHMSCADYLEFIRCNRLSQGIWCDGCFNPSLFDALNSTRH